MTFFLWELLIPKSREFLGKAKAQYGWSTCTN